MYVHGVKFYFFSTAFKGRCALCYAGAWKSSLDVVLIDHIELVTLRSKVTLR
jgi:hypothetical protein